MGRALASVTCVIEDLVLWPGCLDSNLKRRKAMQKEIEIQTKHMKKKHIETFLPKL